MLGEGSERAAGLVLEGSEIPSGGPSDTGSMSIRFTVFLAIGRFRVRAWGRSGGARDGVGRAPR